MRIVEKLQEWILSLHVSGLQAADERAERLVRTRPMRRKSMFWVLVMLLVLVAWVLVPERPAVDWLHVALAAALIPPVAMLGWWRMREVLAGDELEQRIELLAMGLTFVAALCGLVLLVLLDTLGWTLAIRPLWAFYALFLGRLLVVRLVRGHYR